MPEETQVNPQPAEEQEECEKGAPLWMVTFGDMMALMLCFFVLLLSFSQMDVVKFKEVSGSLEQAFGIQRENVVYDMPKGISVIFRLFDGTKLQQTMEGMLKTLVNKHGKRMAEGNVQIEIFKDYRGLVLRVGEEGMFDPGKAEVKPFCWPFLDDLGLLATEIDSTIEVEAHTDDRPVGGTRFRSNWDLSAVRSVSTVDYLIKSAKLIPRRLKAVGRGESIPLVPNTTERGRAINRRVEFVFTEPAHPQTVPEGTVLEE